MPKTLPVVTQMLRTTNAETYSVEFSFSSVFAFYVLGPSTSLRYGITFIFTITFTLQLLSPDLF